MNKLRKLIEKLCPEGVEYKELGEVGKISRGRVISKEYLKKYIGCFPVYSSQTINNGEIGKINTYDFDGKYVTWTTDGAYAGTIFYREGKFSITNICGIIEILDITVINYKFLFYYLSIVSKKYVKGGSGNPKLMSNVMSKIEIPVPPLEIQNEIVRILDVLDQLVNYISDELPVEVKMGQKQHKHYLNKLLKFERRCE
jgi:type I restriction enzyme S subunit